MCTVSFRALLHMSLFSYFKFVKKLSIHVNNSRKVLNHEQPKISKHKFVQKAYNEALKIKIVN